MGEHANERVQRAAIAMRRAYVEAFFAEFGQPDTLSGDEIAEALASLGAIFAGELLQISARFFPATPIRDGAISLLDAMLEHNAEALARMKGEDDKLAFLQDMKEATS